MILNTIVTITEATYFLKHDLKWEHQPHLVILLIKETKNSFLCDLCVIFLPNVEINNEHMPNSQSFCRPFHSMNFGVGVGFAR